MLSGTHDYDRVAYPGLAYPDTHPGQLAVMGLLHGMQPAPVDSCRVLEIACGDGANLLPMAYAIPGSQFVGFDLAAQPIARGQQRIRDLGLANIQLFQANMLEVADTLGQFDYIIAHGLYAWVPEPVRDGLLAFCEKHLSANGIAFISYACMPGGHLRQLFRDIMLQVPQEQNAREFVADGVQLLNFVASARPQDDPFRKLIEQRVQEIEKKSPSATYHDELAEHYRPVSYTAFAAHAQRHGLQCLGEATFPPPNDPMYKPEFSSVCNALGNGNSIAEEQMLDMLRLRSYRETLLCHVAVPLEAQVRVDAFDRLLVTSSAVATPGPGGSMLFSVGKDPGLESRHPPTIAMLQFLIDARPTHVPFSDLVAFMQSQGVQTDPEFRAQILRLAIARFMQLRAWQPPVDTDIAAHPRASSYSRLQAATNATAVVTLSHITFDLSDPVVRQFLLLLDGTRDRPALTAALEQHFPHIPHDSIAANINPMLHAFNNSGLLIAEACPLP